MTTILTALLSKYWKQCIAVVPALALSVFAYVQHVELTNDIAKLATASITHQLDTQEIANLGEQLTDQNDAVAALQAIEATKEQAVRNALAVAQTDQQKVVTLLTPTNGKKPISCADPMPDVRSILRGLSQ